MVDPVTGSEGKGVLLYILTLSHDQEVLAAKLNLTGVVGSITEDGDEDTLHHFSQTSEPFTLGEGTFIKISV
jgi:hypothetical protein